MKNVEFLQKNAFIKVSNSAHFGVDFICKGCLILNLKAKLIDNKCVYRICDLSKSAFKI